MNAKEILQKLSHNKFGYLICLPIRRMDISPDGDIIYTDQDVYILLDDLTHKLHVFPLDGKELICSERSLFLQALTWANKGKCHSTSRSLVLIRDNNEDIKDMIKVHDSIEKMVLFHKILIGLENPQDYLSLDNKDVDTYVFCRDVLDKLDTIR